MPGTISPPHLCEDYHVLALDQRGRGDSEWARDGVYTTEAYVADLLGFSTALGLAPCILVGHSMGGRNSMAFSARYPDKVQKLIVVDIAPGGASPGGTRIRQEIVGVPEEFDSFDAVVDYMSKQNRYAAPEVLRRRLYTPPGRYPTAKLAGATIGPSVSSGARVPLPPKTSGQPGAGYLPDIDRARR